MPPVDDDIPWHPWRGGACPVPPETVVHVRRRYGLPVNARADDLRWSHDQYVGYGADDVIAFAIASDPPPAGY